VETVGSAAGRRPTARQWLGLAAVVSLALGALSVISAGILIATTPDIENLGQFRSFFWDATVRGIYLIPLGLAFAVVAMILRSVSDRQSSRELVASLIILSSAIIAVMAGVWTGRPGLGWIVGTTIASLLPLFTFDTWRSRIAWLLAIVPIAYVGITSVLYPGFEMGSIITSLVAFACGALQAIFGAIGLVRGVVKPRAATV